MKFNISAFFLMDCAFDAGLEIFVAKISLKFYSFELYTVAHFHDLLDKCKI